LLRWISGLRAGAVGQRLEELRSDAAEGVQLQVALQKFRARFAGIVEITEDAIISVDERQHITLFNPGAEMTFGYRAEEVLGRRLDILIPHRFLEAHVRHVESFAASPDALRPMNDRGPVFGLRKDGTEFPAEASISKYDVGGEKVLTVRLRDLTERRQAEAGLSRLAAIVESSEDAIYSKTLDGIVLTWNAGAERLYGYSAQEIQGRPISLVIPPDRAHELALIYERIRRGERVQHYETVRARKDGRQIDVSLSISPIKDVAGKIVAASAIVRDITERKRLEMQMRQAQKMEAIGTLAGGIAHDFNNLLTAINGYTELAGDAVAKGGPAWHNLQEVLAATRRAKDLVRQILTFSRHGEQEQKPVALPAIVREAMRLLRASLPATIEIRQRIDPGCGSVLADPTQMHQVLMNLCANAEYAMRDRGGLLEVGLDGVDVDAEFAIRHPGLAIGPHVRLTVRDTGPGMPPSVRERIFDPFFTTKGPGEGTGLGLAVVHGIVTSHRGVITVDSAPGLGTRFEVFLPRLDAPEHAPTRAEPPIPGGTERILFVDDEPLLTHLWDRMLQGLGYRVLSCTDGLEALEIFRATPEAFDVVITDQTMPKITGEELARELLRLRPDLPIILCTGFSHTMTEEKAKAMGVRAYLTKPLARRDIAQAIRRVLGQYTASNH
jgi:PAS domain S-box-containing protein